MPAREMLEEADVATTSLYRLLRNRLPSEGDKGDFEAWVALARTMESLLTTAWEQLLAQLTRGAEALRARARAGALVNVADAWLEVERLLQEAGTRLARHAAQPLEALAKLAEEKGKVVAIREAAQRTAAYLNDACTAPLDPEQLTQAEAACSEGRFKTGKDLIARLRSPQGIPDRNSPDSQASEAT